MGELEQLEAKVQQLLPDDLARFRRWFNEYDAQLWDRKIENDSRAGKLDVLKAEALGEFGIGRAREL